MVTGPWAASEAFAKTVSTWAGLEAFVIVDRSQSLPNSTLM